MYCIALNDYVNYDGCSPMPTDILSIGLGKMCLLDLKVRVKDLAHSTVPINSFDAIVIKNSLWYNYYDANNRLIRNNCLPFYNEINNDNDDINACNEKG